MTNKDILEVKFNGITKFIIGRNQEDLFAQLHQQILEGRIPSKNHTYRFISSFDMVMEYN